MKHLPQKQQREYLIEKCIAMLNDWIDNHSFEEFKKLESKEIRDTISYNFNVCTKTASEYTNIAIRRVLEQHENKGI